LSIGECGWKETKQYFNNKMASPECTTTQGLSILEHFPQDKDSPPMRIVREEQVDKNVPWDFFDGASQNNGLPCGGGVFLFLSYSHFFKLQMGLGSRRKQLR
jgi:hypothetical protein